MWKAMRRGSGAPGGQQVSPETATEKQAAIYLDSSPAFSRCQRLTRFR